MTALFPVAVTRNIENHNTNYVFHQAGYSTKPTDGILNRHQFSPGRGCFVALNRPSLSNVIAQVHRRLISIPLFLSRNTELS
jgi:hypothetical protein